MTSPGRKGGLLPSFFFQPTILITEGEHFRFNQSPDTSRGKKSNCYTINDKRRQFPLERKSQIVIKGKRKKCNSLTRSRMLECHQNLGSFLAHGSGTVMGSLSIHMALSREGSYPWCLSMVYAALVGRMTCPTTGMTRDTYMSPALLTLSHYVTLNS